MFKILTSNINQILCYFLDLFGLYQIYVTKLNQKTNEKNLIFTPNCRDLFCLQKKNRDKQFFIKINPSGCSTKPFNSFSVKDHH